MNMKNIFFISAAILVPIFLSACEETPADRIKKFETRVAANRLGSSTDYWLVKNNRLGNWERVALVFGFADDRRVCEELLDLYARRYPSERYRCQPAN
jgi:hypothetical protein